MNEPENIDRIASAFALEDHREAAQELWAAFTKGVPEDIGPQVARILAMQRHDNLTSITREMLKLPEQAHDFPRAFYSQAFKRMPPSAIIETDESLRASSPVAEAALATFYGQPRRRLTLPGAAELFDTMGAHDSRPAAFVPLEEHEETHMLLLDIRSEVSRGVSPETGGYCADRFLRYPYVVPDAALKVMYDLPAEQRHTMCRGLLEAGRANESIEMTRALIHDFPAEDTYLLFKWRGEKKDAYESTLKATVRLRMDRHVQGLLALPYADEVVYRGVVSPMGWMSPANGERLRYLFHMGASPERLISALEVRVRSHDSLTLDREALTQIERVAQAARDFPQRAAPALAAYAQHAPIGRNAEAVIDQAMQIEIKAANHLAPQSRIRVQNQDEMKIT